MADLHSNGWDSFFTKSMMIQGVEISFSMLLAFYVVLRRSSAQIQHLAFSLYKRKEEMCKIDKI